MVFSKVYIYCCMNFIQSILFPVSLVCQPKSKMYTTDRSAFVGWLLDYLVGWMAVVAWWAGCMVMPGWLAAWKKVDVANWMQRDLLCFRQIEDTIF